MTQPRTLKLPITNVYALGDYTVRLHLGSEQSPVNLLLDTGSSPLVVKHGTYVPKNDKQLKATAIAQEVTYGIGGWNGPMVNTLISIGDKDPITLESSHIALVSGTEQAKTFGNADGMLGLAYHHLNKGFNLAGYFQQKNVSPALTYPWPFNPSSQAQSIDPEVDSTDLKGFKSFLWRYPEHDITPYFTELEQHKLTANKFAFYSKRSSIHIADNGNSDTEQLLQDPLNQGFLILGGGEEHIELYQGEFSSIRVENDVYYNVVLTSVQVGDKKPIIALPLAEKDKSAYFTNAIIDTGAGGIVLTADIYQQMVTDLIAINPGFEALITPFQDINAQQTGIDASLLNLEQWPEIKFNFVKSCKTGDDGTVIKTTTQLVCQPDTYWQINAPKQGKACFKILSQLPQWPNQSIIGLPLINNYHVVFDRLEHKTCAIKFARPK